MPTSKQRKSRNGNKLPSRMSAVRADLNTLQKDVRGLVSNASDVASREVRGVMGEAVERLGTLRTESIAGVRDAVRNQPLKACAISIGAGAIIGALLLR
jgi:ElaB/YqjD/DUF883 family membrane-anchored ribosome-binding protein